VPVLSPALDLAPTAGGGWALRLRTPGGGLLAVLLISGVLGVVLTGGGGLAPVLLGCTVDVGTSARRHSRPVWLERMTTVLPAVMAAAGLLGLMSVKSSGRLVPVPPGFMYTRLVALSAARNAPEQEARLVVKEVTEEAGRVGPTAGGGGLGGDGGAARCTMQQVVNGLPREELVRHMAENIMALDEKVDEIRAQQAGPRSQQSGPACHGCMLWLHVVAACGWLHVVAGTQACTGLCAVGKGSWRHLLATGGQCDHYKCAHTQAGTWHLAPLSTWHFTHSHTTGIGDSRAGSTAVKPWLLVLLPGGAGIPGVTVVVLLTNTAGWPTTVGTRGTLL
jgi:hypothetical protein